MKQIVIVLCSFSLCSIPGMSQKWSSRSVMTDQQFVDIAGEADMVDAHLGQLAETEAPLKDYAQKLVSDQTSAFQALSKAARQTSLKVPDAIDKADNTLIIDPFQKLTGAAFDRRFVSELIKGDARSINIYEKEVRDTRTATLKSYAEEALPILRLDLANAKKLKKSTAVPTKKG